MESTDIMQFKIVLRDIKPPIWRRIQVPGDWTFWDLHVAIQDSMGWSDSHLHEFQVQDPEQDCEVLIGIPDDETPDSELLAGWEVQIEDVFGPDIGEAVYLYDFGDGWEHRVLPEKLLRRDTATTYPRCIDGQRMCPPEDCGGPDGYQNLLEILADPSHEEHYRVLDWLGGEFDPEESDHRDVRFENPRDRLELILSEL